MKLPHPTVYLHNRVKKRSGWGKVHTWFLFDYSGPAELQEPKDNELSELAWMQFPDIISQTASIRMNPYRQVRSFLEESGFQVS